MYQFALSSFELLVLAKLKNVKMQIEASFFFAKLRSCCSLLCEKYASISAYKKASDNCAGFF
jgi:hypothetical protein